MRNTAAPNPNLLLAAMVATGSWFGFESSISTHVGHASRSRAEARRVALAPATGWAARSMAPVGEAGCAAALTLLLVLGLRTLARDGIESAFESFIAPLPGPFRSSAATFLRSLRRGGLYGP